MFFHVVISIVSLCVPINDTGSRFTTRMNFSKFTSPRLCPREFVLPGYNDHILWCSFSSIQINDNLTVRSEYVMQCFSPDLVSAKVVSVMPRCRRGYNSNCHKSEINDIAIWPTFLLFLFIPFSTVTSSKAFSLRKSNYYGPALELDGAP